MEQWFIYQPVSAIFTFSSHGIGFEQYNWFEYMTKETSKDDLAFAALA